MHREGPGFESLILHQTNRNCPDFELNLIDECRYMIVDFWSDVGLIGNGWCRQSSFIPLVHYIRNQQSCISIHQSDAIGSKLGWLLIAFASVGSYLRSGGSTRSNPELSASKNLVFLLQTAILETMHPITLELAIQITYYLAARNEASPFCQEAPILKSVLIFIFIELICFVSLTYKHHHSSVNPAHFWRIWSRFKCKNGPLFQGGSAKNRLQNPFGAFISLFLICDRLFRNFASAQFPDAIWAVFRSVALRLFFHEFSHHFLTNSSFVWNNYSQPYF